MTDHDETTPPVDRWRRAERLDALLRNSFGDAYEGRETAGTTEVYDEQGRYVETRIHHADGTLGVFVDEGERQVPGGGVLWHNDRDDDDEQDDDDDG